MALPTVLGWSYTRLGPVRQKDLHAFQVWYTPFEEGNADFS